MDVEAQQQTSRHPSRCDRATHVAGDDQIEPLAVGWHLNDVACQQVSSIASAQYPRSKASNDRAGECGRARVKDGGGDEQRSQRERLSANIGLWAHGATV